MRRAVQTAANMNGITSGHICGTGRVPQICLFLFQGREHIQSVFVLPTTSRFRKGNEMRVLNSYSRMKGILS